MTQEEKELLLKDLCARLLYGMKCKDQYGDYININIYNAHIEHLVDQIGSGIIQMILRPMSSMTKEERNEYLSIKMQETERVALAEISRPEAVSEIMDWLNSHHFDYRGLIPMGLALEEPKGMYNIKEK